MDISAGSYTESSPDEDDTYTSYGKDSQLDYITQPSLSQFRMLNLSRSDLNSAIDSSYCILDQGTQKWQCRLCSKGYASKHNLVSHILCHMGVRPHVCNICGKAFKQSAHLGTHLLIHQGIRPHKCPVCQRAFSQVAQVKRHVMTHVNKAPYICPVCRHECETPLELQVHLVEHASGLGQDDSPKKKTPDLFSVAKGATLRCEQCTRIFVYPSQLREHMMFHSGARMFPCPLCSMSFIKEHHLRAHQSTHTDQRPHTCPQCNRSFSLKGNLQRHLLIHQGDKSFQCQVCFKKFTQAQTLKMHSLTHSKQKPFRCEVCGKTFTRGHNYRGHVALHRDSKPYTCSVCSSAFTLRANLRRHCKEKHPATSHLYLPANIDAEQLLNEQFEPAAGLYSPSKVLESTSGEFLPFKKKARKTTPKKVSQLVDPPEPLDELPPLPLEVQFGSSYTPDSQSDNSKEPITYHSLIPLRKSLEELEDSRYRCDSDERSPLDETVRPDETSRYLACMRRADDDNDVSKYFRRTDATGDIIHKVHVLHTAINSLAVQCGEDSDKVHAIHSVIDELAGKAVQSSLYQ